MQRKMDELVERLCAQGEYVGLSVLVMRSGEPIYRKLCGYADAERGIPMGEKTIFQLYSMTKPITAAAVMKLWEDGLIDLMDPVSRYLPAFTEQKVWRNGALEERVGEIELHDLLNMTSGIPYPGDQAAPSFNRLFEEAEAAADGPGALGTVELANRIGREPLSFQPGERWMYGASADVLGAVVEVASGMRFGDYLRRELFEPLGMEDTGFFVPEEKAHRLAVIHRILPDGTPVPYRGNHLVVFPGREEPAFQSGGAGLFSTVDDYAAFQQMLLGEGTYRGRRILHPSTVRFLRTAQLTDRQKETFGWPALRGYSYGNLMRVLESPALQCVTGPVGEFGWDGWTCPYMELHPDQHVSILMMASQIDREITCSRRILRNCIYRDLLY